MAFYWKILKFAPDISEIVSTIDHIAPKYQWNHLKRTNNLPLVFVQNVSFIHNWQYASFKMQICAISKHVDLNLYTRQYMSIPFSRCTFTICLFPRLLWLLVGWIDCILTFSNRYRESYAPICVLSTDVCMLGRA